MPVATSPLPITPVGAAGRDAAAGGAVPTGPEACRTCGAPSGAVSILPTLTATVPASRVRTRKTGPSVAASPPRRGRRTRPRRGSAPCRPPARRPGSTSRRSAFLSTGKIGRREGLTSAQPPDVGPYVGESLFQRNIIESLPSSCCTGAVVAQRTGIYEKRIAVILYGPDRPFSSSDGLESTILGEDQMILTRGSFDPLLR